MIERQHLLGQNLLCVLHTENLLLIQSFLKIVPNLEKFLSSNNDLEDKIPPAYMSHKESYENEVQRTVKIFQKLKTLQGAKSVEKSL